MSCLHTAGIEMSNSSTLGSYNIHSYLHDENLSFTMASITIIPPKVLLARLRGKQTLSELKQS